MSWWTPERDEEATRLFRVEGYSAGMIAKRLGAVSRNSVIGRLFRLGVKREGASAPTKSMKYPEGRKSSPPRATNGRIVATAFKSGGGKPGTPRAPLPDLSLVPDTAKPFWERRVGECSWPYGSGAEMHSCCRPVARQGWCEGHARIGLEPSKESKSKKAKRVESLASYMERRSA